MRRMIVAQGWPRREPVFWGRSALHGGLRAGCAGGFDLWKNELWFQSDARSAVLYGYGLNGLIPVSGLILAGAVSFFVGTQYSGGTPRLPWLLAGRAEIYIGHYLVSALMALAYHLFLYRADPGDRLAVFGGFQLDAGTLALGALAGGAGAGGVLRAVQCRGAACSSRTVTSILCLSGVILAMFLGAYVSSWLQEPARVDVLEMRDGSSQVKSMENPRYLRFCGGAAGHRGSMFCPAGNACELGSQKLLHWRWSPGISAGLIVFVNAGGLFLFQRKELK